MHQVKGSPSDTTQTEVLRLAFCGNGGYEFVQFFFGRITPPTLFPLFNFSRLSHHNMMRQHVTLHNIMLVQHKHVVIFIGASETFVGCKLDSKAPTLGRFNSSRINVLKSRERPISYTIVMFSPRERNPTKPLNPNVNERIGERFHRMCRVNGILALMLVQICPHGTFGSRLSRRRCGLSHEDTNQQQNDQERAAKARCNVQADARSLLPALDGCASERLAKRHRRWTGVRHGNPLSETEWATQPAYTVSIE